MDVFVALIIGTGILLVIAFPERFLPVAGEKKKRVGANYWGAYKDSQPTESAKMPTIETIAIKKKGNVIAGSTSYTMGRGVSGSSST